MKKIITILILTTFTFVSCSIEDDYNRGLHLREFLHSYELWHIDVNQTRGYTRIPMLNRAFTITFHSNERVTANNNLVGLGVVGNGYGRPIGGYNTSNEHLTIFHDREGVFHFEVVQVSNNQIDLVDLNSDAVYRLVGYQKRNFDYDQLFFDNIIYFLQEYEFWEKTYTSIAGNRNLFDEENILTFFSNQGAFRFETKNNPYSHNLIGYGAYNVENTSVRGKKRLTLFYGSGVESFELKVINDQTIELFHLNSGTLYEFVGRQGIVFLSDKKAKDKVL